MAAGDKEVSDTCAGALPVQVGRGDMSMHTLYRFYDASDTLLYIGITGNMPARMAQHRADKSWWPEVSVIRLEQFQSRAELQSAERESIRIERPKYNKVFNGQQHSTGSNRSRQNDFTPLSEGNFVGLGLCSGECPVGVILYVDECFITLGLKSFLTGYYDQERRTYRLAQVETVAHAFRDEDGFIDDDHLAKFQSRWSQEKVETK